MTILNEANDGLLSVLLVLIRTSAKIGCPIQRDELLDLVGPRSVFIDKDGIYQEPEMLKKTLKTWTDLGFFVDEPRGLSMVGDDNWWNGAQAMGTDLMASKQVRRAIRRCIFKPENNQDLGKDNKGMAADFTFAVCWLLSRNVYDWMPEKWPNIEAAQVQDAFGNNDVNWRGFKRWAPYLGFGWLYQKKKLVIDPTVALSDELDECFIGRTEIVAESFLEKLAALLPVIDQGRYRQRVEASRPDTIATPRPGYLSQSLSRGLLGLRDAQLIEFERRADAEHEYRLTRGTQDGDVSVFTHIARRVP